MSSKWNYELLDKYEDDPRWCIRLDTMKSICPKYVLESKAQYLTEVMNYVDDLAMK